MCKTSLELVEYARSKIGLPYVYGTKMEVLTADGFNDLQSSYGKHLVWDSDASKIGQVCSDCSGLISSYTGVPRNSQGYRDAAEILHPISSIEEAPLGALVWREGHVGVYSGMSDGVPYYIAFDGSAYGCRESELNNNFTHWFLCPDVEYIEEGINEQRKESTVRRYNEISEMPDWAKATIQKLVDKRYLLGDGTGLNLSEDMIRVFVVNDKAGLYN